MTAPDSEGWGGAGGTLAKSQSGSKSVRSVPSTLLSHGLQMCQQQDLESKTIISPSQSLSDNEVLHDLGEQ